MSASYLDPTVGAFLSSLAYYAVFVVAFLIILQAMGIQATSLVAIVGAASLAIGLAVQDTLSNVAAGIMLLIFRPFRLGDSIEVAGKSGTVKNLNLFMTELASGDNVQVLIPNGQVWGGALTNFSAYPTRRVSVSFPIALDKDAPRTVLRILAHPVPFLREIDEKSYQWEGPFRIDDRRFRARLRHAPEDVERAVLRVLVIRQDRLVSQTSRSS
jgi:small conductance mechanosensitive channel